MDGLFESSSESVRVRQWRRREGLGKQGSDGGEQGCPSKAITQASRAERVRQYRRRVGMYNMITHIDMYNIPKLYTPLRNIRLRL